MNPALSCLLIQYVACFPLSWKKQICYYWKSKDEKTETKLVLAIAPLSNTRLDPIFIKSCLLKKFVIVSEHQNMFELQDFNVVLLHEVVENLGIYYMYKHQKCNIKNFIHINMYPFSFKQPKHFICLKRPRKLKKIDQTNETDSISPERTIDGDIENSLHISHS
jgi:hypothetical protein